MRVLLVLVLLVLSTSAAAQSSRATERVTLTVEIRAREETRTISCGFFGPQPRDVTAHVISVDQGTYEGDTVLLRWPVCSLGEIPIGGRFQVYLRRFVGVPASPTMRFRVRGAEAR